MHFRLVFLTALVVAGASACRRLPNIQGRGAEELQGVWVQDSMLKKDKLLNYTEYQFKFSCDSFYVDLITHSKVNYYEDSCFNDGVWKEYAKGVYALRDDSLFLEGTYTKANYKQKISGCYHIGRYIKSFIIKESSDTSLTLLSLSDQRLHQLVLRDKIICIPKEL